MVIDASVALKWIVPEPDSDVALAFLGGDHVAPGLLMSEVGNALWKKVRRGELTTNESFDEQIESLPKLVEIVGDSVFATRALQMAIALDHPIYDCVYLAMAEQLGTELLTADHKFARKAGAGGFGHVVRTL